MFLTLMGLEIMQQPNSLSMNKKNKIDQNQETGEWTTIKSKTLQVNRKMKKYYK